MLRPSYFFINIWFSLIKPCVDLVIMLHLVANFWAFRDDYFMIKPSFMRYSSSFPSAIIFCQSKWSRRLKNQIGWGVGLFFWEAHASNSSWIHNFTLCPMQGNMHLRSVCGSLQLDVFMLETTWLNGST
jgi:hypothetical protein